MKETARFVTADMIRAHGTHRHHRHRLGSALVTRGDIDVVTVLTPPSEHVTMAVAALDAGKHLICEKPTALNAAEAEKIVDAGRRNPGRVAIIDHELRFLPSFRAARARMADLGPIRYAEARYASPSRGDRARVE